MLLEKGKDYLARNGQRWTNADMDIEGVWEATDETMRTRYRFDSRGQFMAGGGNCPHDLISEWQDPEAPAAGPVRTTTVTRTEIIPGLYGKVRIHAALSPAGTQSEWTVDMAMSGKNTAAELRAAAATLLALADALESQP